MIKKNDSVPVVFVAPTGPKTAPPGVWARKRVLSLQRVKGELPSRASFQPGRRDKRSSAPQDPPPPQVRVFKTKEVSRRRFSPELRRRLRWDFSRKCLANSVTLFFQRCSFYYQSEDTVRLVRGQGSGKALYVRKSS